MPFYRPGLWVTAGLQLFILALVSVLSLYFWRKNKQVDNGTISKPIEGLEGFKYTL
jgi:nicotinamide riboside transporter PnuC